MIQILVFQLLFTKLCAFPIYFCFYFQNLNGTLGSPWVYRQQFQSDDFQFFNMIISSSTFFLQRCSKKLSLPLWRSSEFDNISSGLFFIINASYSLRLGTNKTEMDTDPPITPYDITQTCVCSNK